MSYHLKTARLMVRALALIVTGLVLLPVLLIVPHFAVQFGQVLIDMGDELEAHYKARSM